MRIVIGTVALEVPGGTETYCLTVARELERLGHGVTIVAGALGPLAERALEEGLDVVEGVGELSGDVDAVLANDAISAGLLAERYPKARRAFCVHSSRFDVQLPPFEAGVVHVLIALSERFAAHARSLALEVPVVLLTQPIDTLFYTPSAPLPELPRRALLLSHYLDGPRRNALVDTWSSAGIDCVQVGFQHRLSLDVRADIAEADIVVGKARAALEAMACGKAVYIFDSFGGDGWVTAENFAALEADNFAGMATARPVDRDKLTLDLKGYNPDMGWIDTRTGRHPSRRPGPRDPAGPGVAPTPRHHVRRRAEPRRNSPIAPDGVADASAG